MTWVRPALVAEVAYAERTNEGILRQASFMGLREDMPAKSVGEEKPQPPPAPDAVLGIRISSPQRLVWPRLGISKLELARYVEFTRAEWARLRDATPLPLSEAQLWPLAGVNEQLSLGDFVMAAPALAADDAVEELGG